MAALAHSLWVLGYYHFELYVPARPDAPAAAAFVESIRRPDEPVVVGGFQYFPLQYYARDTREWAAYDPSGRLPTYLGAQVLRPDERVIGDAGLRALAVPTVIVVDALNEGQTIAPP